MGSQLTEKFMAENNAGRTMSLAGYRFRFAVNHDDYGTIDLEDFKALRESLGTIVAGPAQLIVFNTIYNKEPCDSASNIIPSPICEKVREDFGEEKIYERQQSYQELLKEIRQDLISFEGQLHEDPKIHSAMLVDYLINQRMKYSSDPDHQRMEELWAHPAETAHSLKGDCEDYAILKLELLKDLKIVKEGDAFIAVVGTKDNGPHAPLIIIGDDDIPYVLDNYAADEENLLEPSATPLDEYMENMEFKFDSLYDGYNIYKFVSKEEDQDQPGVSGTQPIVEPAVVNPTDQPTLSPAF